MTSAEIFKEIAIKLLSIVSNQHIWEAKAADNVSPYKILDLQSGDGGECFFFRPFGEVINYHYHELILTLAFGERANYIDSPLR